MDTLATSLMDMWNTPGVAEKLEETARVYFANSILTINLIPALLVGALLLFLLPVLLGLPVLNGLLGGGGGGASYGSNLEISDGYGAPSPSYGAPEPSYGAPEPSYGAPEPSYGAPAASYDAPASNSYDAPASNSYDAPVSNSYDTPSSGYDAGRRKRSVEFPSEARDLYSDLNLDAQPFEVSGAHLDQAFVPAASPLAASLPSLN
jgi:hypothetical protein